VGLEDFTFPVAIAAQLIASLQVDIAAQSIGFLKVDIAAQSIDAINVNATIVQSNVTLDVNVTGSTVTLNVNIAGVASGVTVPISIQSSAVTLNVSIVSSTVTLNVRIAGVASGVVVPISIQSSAVTLNVNITASTVTLNTFIQDFKATISTASLLEKGSRIFKDSIVYNGTVTMYTVPTGKTAYLYLMNFVGINYSSTYNEYLELRVIVGGTIYALISVLLKPGEVRDGRAFAGLAKLVEGDSVVLYAASDVLARASIHVLEL